MYNVQCTLYSIHCTMYIIQCTLYTHIIDVSCFQCNSTYIVRFLGVIYLPNDVLHNVQYMYGVQCRTLYRHLCTVYIVYGIYCVWYTLCTAYIVYGIHCVRHTLCTTYTVYDIHCIRHTLCTIYTVHDVHCVRHTLCTANYVDIHSYTQTIINVHKLPYKLILYSIRRIHIHVYP